MGPAEVTSHVGAVMVMFAMHPATVSEYQRRSASVVNREPEIGWYCGWFRAAGVSGRAGMMWAKDSVLATRLSNCVVSYLRNVEKMPWPTASSSDCMRVINWLAARARA